MAWEDVGLGTDDDLRISPAVQARRDTVRLAMLERERDESPLDDPARADIEKEIDFARRGVDFSGRRAPKPRWQDAPLVEEARAPAWASAPLVEEAPVAPKPTVPERTWGEALKDTLLDLGGAAGSVGEMAGTAYGLATGNMDNPVREAGKNAREYYEAQQSPALKAKERERAAAIKAEDSEVGKFARAVSDTALDPALLGSFLTKQIPQLIGPAGVGRVLGWGAKALGAAAPAAGKVAVGGAIGTGATMQGSDVGGNTFDDLMDPKKVPQSVWEQNEVYTELRKAVPDAEAKKQVVLLLARESAAKGAAISAAVQFLPGGSTIERALVGAGAKPGSRVVGAVKGGTGEGFSESLEEGGGKVAGNVAVREVDPSRAMTEGVGEAAGMGFVGGVGMGGVAGAAGARPAPSQAGPDSAQPLPAAEILDQPATVPGTPAWASAPLVDEVALDAAHTARPQSEAEMRNAVEFEPTPVPEAAPPSPAPQVGNEVAFDRPGALALLDEASGLPRPHDELAAELQRAPAPAEPAALEVPGEVQPTDAGIENPARLTPQQQYGDALAKQQRGELLSSYETALLAAPPESPKLVLPWEAERSLMRERNVTPEQWLGQGDILSRPFQPETIEITRDVDALADLNPAAAREIVAAVEAYKPPKEESRAPTPAPAAEAPAQAPDPAPAPIREEAGPAPGAAPADQGQARAVPAEEVVAAAPVERVVGKGAPGAPVAERGPPAGAPSRKAKPTETPADAGVSASGGQVVAIDGLPRETIADITYALQDKVPAFKGMDESDIEAEIVGLADEVVVEAREVPVGSVKMSPQRAISEVAVDAYAKRTTEAPPILVDGANLIEGGHRLRAAQKRGDKTIRVVDVGPLLRTDWKTWMEGGEKQPSDPVRSNRPQAAIVGTPPPVDTAAHEAATSPKNDKPEPTLAQKEAGNYAKGHVRIAGLDISIENPAGSKRRPRWPALKSHYGYIKGTVGRDKDHVDIFVKPGTPEDYSGPVFVVDQITSKGRFDEHKVVLGAASIDEAKALYSENYTKGFKVGPVTQMTQEQFRTWKSSPFTKRAVKSLSRSEWAQVEATTRTPKMVDRLMQVEGEIGWAEEGGRMIRAVDTGGEKPEVVGRTSWVAKSDFWPGRPTSVTASIARSALAKVKDGKPLSVPEQRFVDYANEWLGRKEAEAAAPKERAVERRSDDGQRKRVAEMNPAEMRKALLTDDLTGLGNRRAFEEAPKKAVQVSADADNLKWINDALGHDAGDQLLSAIGEAFKAAKVEGFHISGDEFTAAFDTEEDAYAAMGRVKGILNNAVLTFERPDGSLVTKTGVGLSYGIGPDTATAEIDLQRDKSEREDEGHRAARGEEPPSIRREAAPGQQAREREAPEVDEQNAPSSLGAEGLAREQERAYEAREPDPPGTPPRATGGAEAASEQPVRGPRTPVRGGRWLALGITDHLKHAGATSLVGREVGSAKELAELAQIYRNPRYEVFRVFFTKEREIVHATGVSARLPGMTPAFPDNLDGDAGYAWLRAQMDSSGADGYWLLHNHPSGIPDPSDVDLSLTKEMAGALPGFRGHVIINHESFATLAADGSHKIESVETENLHVATVPSPFIGQDIRSPSSVFALGSALRKDGWITLIGHGNRGVSAIMEIPVATWSHPARGRAVLRAFARKGGAQKVYVYGNKADLMTAGRTEIDARVIDGYAGDVVNEYGASVRSGVWGSGRTYGRQMTGREVKQPEYSAKPAMTAAAVRKALTSVIARSKVPIAVVQSVKEAGLNLHADTRGVFHEGRIYVIADNLADELAAERTAARHELVHAGWDLLYGGKDALRERALRDLQSKNKRLREYASGWRIQYGEEFVSNGIALGKTEADARKEMILRSMEEATAYYAESVEELHGWRSFLAVIQRGLRQIGLHRFANWLETATDAEARAAIAELLRATEKTAAPAGKEPIAAAQPALSREPPKYARAAPDAEKKPRESEVGRPSGPIGKTVRSIASVPDKIDALLARGGGRWAAEHITKPIYNGVIELGSHLPEKLKAGLVSDYGLTDLYVDRRNEMRIGQREGVKKAKESVDLLVGLNRAQSRIAYQWMNRRDPEGDRLLGQLPPAEQRVLRDLKQLITDMGREAVDLGQLPAEAYERNKGAYLHRAYAKFEMDDTPQEKTARAKAIKVLGEQYRGRGMLDQVDAAAFEQLPVKGDKFARLEQRTAVTDKEVEGGAPAGTERLRRVVYVPTKKPVPEAYKGWKRDPSEWEVRHPPESRQGKVGLWRDFTPDERTRMGELDEVKFAVAKTLIMMTKDLETGRLLKWVGEHHGKESREGLTVVETPTGRALNTFDKKTWVQVPDTKIPGTDVKAFGDLAGKYVPSPIWNDLRQITSARFNPLGDFYAGMMRAWKISKTALSPATHMNNVMSNFILADAAGLGGAEVYDAMKVFVDAKRHKNPKAIELLARYDKSGGELGSYAVSELQRETLQPLLDEMRDQVNKADNEGALVHAASIVSLMLYHRQFKEAFRGGLEKVDRSSAAWVTRKAAGAMITAYQSEDAAFRFATWLKAVNEGKSDLEAGKLARTAFLDYNISAPWIANLRGTILPFIAFSYRAAPMLAKITAEKPWKIAKYMAVAGILNQLGYFGSGGDEDRERQMLPEEKSGRLWGIVPKLIRMPLNDDNDSPVFLDIRRWIPVGDIVDFGQNHSAIPVPPVLFIGGPLAVLGEIYFNKSAFTGKPITLETDTPGEIAKKTAQHLYQWAAPNLPFLPWTYSYERIMDAGTGMTDAMGREQSVPMALSSSVGVKLGTYPADVLAHNLKSKFSRDNMELDMQFAKIKRRYERKGIDDDELKDEIEKYTGKKLKLREDVLKKVSPSSSE